VPPARRGVCLLISTVIFPQSHETLPYLCALMSTTVFCSPGAEAARLTSRAELAHVAAQGHKRLAGPGITEWLITHRDVSGDSRLGSTGKRNVRRCRCSCFAEERHPVRPARRGFESDTALRSWCPQGGYTRCLIMLGIATVRRPTTAKRRGPNQGSNGQPYNKKYIQPITAIQKQKTNTNKQTN